MFLKSLEIRGFKSFADKTELKFDKGITAVVGPNGSGKSNVSDSVRWVLGEQSAKTLRGSKMEDIIFSGTDYRKPLGLAQVSLTLDNSNGELPIEYNDVKVTRRVFRSGDSEYLINNSPCRLKDIVNLFMDTGIGKEGYSLIGQGKIDAILNGKPEDRRALLEEAAGIVKFKSRKIEAERKLENTNENLIRINDIIYTYEERIGPLEEEKLKAEKYLDYAKELKGKEISLILNSVSKLKNEMKVQKDKIDNLLQDNSYHKENYKGERNRLATLKENIENTERNKNSKQKDYFSKKESISKNLNEIDILNERFKNFESYIKTNTLELKEKEKRLVDLKNEKEKLNGELSKNTEEDLALEEKINILEKEIFNSDKILKENEEKKEKIKENEIKFLNDISNYKNKIVLLKNQNESFLETIKSIEDSKLSLENNLKINMKTKDDLSKELYKLLQEKSILEKSMEEALSEKKEVEEKTEKINSELGKIGKNINVLEANRDMLKNLEKQYEGYSFSVKNLMKAILNGDLYSYNKKCFVLGDTIRVNKGYETAIEVALGGAISNIITEDETIAKELIEYLKKKRLGRATFLPLSIIKSNKVKLDKDLVSSKGYLCLACEAVGFEKKFENIINSVLGKTIICDNIDNGLVLARKINYRNRIITLSGDVINSGGSLTGGSLSQKNLGIMSRKVEIDDLNKKVINLSLKRDKLSLKLNNLKEKNLSLESLKREITEKIYNSKIDNINLKNKINNLNEEINKTRNTFESSKIKVHDLKEKVEKNKISILDINNNLSLIKDERIDDDKLLREINFNIDNFSKKVLKLRDDITFVKVKRAKIQESLSNLLRDVKKCEEEYINSLKRCEVLKDYINKNSLEKGENLKKIEENNIFIKEAKEELILLEEDIKFFEDKRNKLKLEISNIEDNLELMAVNIAKKDEEIHRNEIIYTKQENERKLFYSRLEDEFNTSYEEEKDNFKEIEDFQEHKRYVESLKGRINKLGQVNVNSIEQFKEVSQKYNFIKMEKEDLEKAKDELLNVIDEMLSKMKVVFRQNFNILNKNFQDTFRELFKGGNAKLILDEDDELNGNIEINVQPPGKKVQNINLMSGGEKVLSAIAILFAILKMKPTPFCILDEIEAALDDANVNRYADFLKKFSENVQFIVITHRKGTMESSDIMYGVTMEEKGVSKIVSIDLAR
ncbi:MAG: chromosome segregation protein SMC [Clostridium perfringens]|nr:chromosome segregation protein SMC [Clostridium perfringens]